jgi:hypothetical protein
MRKALVSTLLALTMIGAAVPAQADLNNCENLYVGRIWLEQGYGLRAVVLLATPTAPSGSYWMYFDNWSAEERKTALAMLAAAKISGHRVHATTTEAGQCGVSISATFVKTVFLASQP